MYTPCCIDFASVAKVPPKADKDVIVDRTGKSTCCLAGNTISLVTKTRRHLGGPFLTNGLYDLPRMCIWLHPKLQTQLFSTKKSKPSMTSSTSCEIKDITFMYSSPRHTRTLASPANSITVPLAARTTLFVGRIK